MKAIIEMPPNQPQRGTASRVAWFIGLWLAGVASVGLVSLILRAWIGS